VPWMLQRNAALLCRWVSHHQQQSPETASLDKNAHGNALPLNYLYKPCSKKSAAHTFSAMCNRQIIVYS
jgi:hypothetical protein